MILRYFAHTLLLAAVCSAATNPLFTAIRNNDLAGIRSLAVSKASANAAGDRGTTPLLYASAYGSLEAMRILLDAGADPNAKNAFDATPLMWCVSEMPKVRLLLDHGADVNAKSKTGRTPLLLAALAGGSEKTVAMLLAKGADPKAIDKDGLSFLLAAAEGNNPGEIRTAVELGAQVDGKDSQGFTALMWAASNGDPASVKFLLTRHADVNAITGTAGFGKVKNGDIQLGKFTALMLAATYGPPAMVKLLLDAGAKLDTRDVRGMTALHYAVATEAQNPEIVRMLLKAGADPAAKMENGESAMDWAAKFSVPSVMRLLPASASGKAQGKLAPDVSSELPARAAAERGMKILEKVSGGFMNTGGCISCHAQNLTALTASYAKAHGLATDNEMQQQQLAGGKAFVAGGGDQLLLRQDPPGGIDSIDYMLLHFSAAGLKSDPAVDAPIHNIVAQQLPDGSWHSGGIARAPMEDGDIARTALAVRAIQHFAWPGRQADLTAHLESAHAWLKRATPIYNEEYAMQILGLKWAGETKEQLAGVSRKLIAQQREDGGWSQNPNLGSDAYATGQTLLALAEAGLAPSSPVFKRGAQFLVRTQHPDGSWHVASRAPKLQPYFQSGFPHDHDQWISMAATSWATIALSFAAEPAQQARVF